MFRMFLCFVSFHLISFFLQGLRVSALLGAFGTCAGAWIKTFSVSPDLFYVTFIGQSVVAVSQVFILSLPARVAAVWFGPNQVSSACSIGVFGNQLGVAVGFVLPSIMVKNHEQLEDIGSDLKVMFYSIAIFSSILLVLMILCKPIYFLVFFQIFQRFFFLLSF